MFSEEQILQALRQAPEAVQEAFGSDQTASAIIAIQEKYNLHVDVAGEIGRDVGYMLLGFIDPMAFLQNLTKRGFDPETAKNIVNDINQEIFLPLQQRMKEGLKDNDEDFDDEAFEEAISAFEKPVVQQPPRAQPMAQVPAIEVRVPVPTTSVNLMQGISSQSFDVPGSHIDDSEQVPPIQETSLTLPGSMPPTPHPWQTSPARSFQTASVPYTSVPHVSQPVELPTTPASQASLVKQTPLPQETRPAVAPPSSPQPSNPITKEYSLDPYREPIQ